MTEQTHPVDKHVGDKARLRRKQLGLSMEKVGEKIGISQQQLSKYEIGENRFSASRLYELAQALDVSVAWFYEGLEQSSTRPEAIAFTTAYNGLSKADKFAVNRIVTSLSEKEKK